MLALLLSLSTTLFFLLESWAGCLEIEFLTSPGNDFGSSAIDVGTAGILINASFKPTKHTQTKKK